MGAQNYEPKPCVLADNSGAVELDLVAILWDIFGKQPLQVAHVSKKGSRIGALRTEAELLTQCHLFLTTGLRDICRADI